VLLLLLVLVLLLLLVLVLDGILLNGLSSLDQFRQHRNDPFEIGFSNPRRFRVNRTRRFEYIMNRGTLQSRPTGDLEESILILETLLSVPLGNIQRNRLRRTQPLVSSMAIDARQGFRDAKRRGDVLDC
jgi:hypothetical protein